MVSFNAVDRKEGDVAGATLGYTYPFMFRRSSDEVDVSGKEVVIGLGEGDCEMD